MADWRRIVEEFFRCSDPDGEFHHEMRPGALAGTIDTVQSELGLQFPDECREFYRHFNGIGLVAAENGDDRLFVKPVEELPKFAQSCRSMFAETHANHASRFFPIIDWGNGDATGYLLDDNGDLLPHLHTVMHELYRYDEDQVADEFIQSTGENFANFLTPD